MESSLDTSRLETSPTAFAVAHREVGERTCVVSVEGDLDLASAPQLKWTLVELLEKGYAQYVIDLSGLTYMDSMGLGVLVGFRKRIEGSAQLTLACLPPSQGKLLELTGLDACFDSFPSVDEALSTNSVHALPLCTYAAMALGLAGGLVPCWDAVLLIVLAEALGRLRLGLVLLAAFSLGMAHFDQGSR